MSASDAASPNVHVQAWPGLAMTSGLQLVLVLDELPGIGDDLEIVGRGIPRMLSDRILLLVLARIPEALTDLAVTHGAMLLQPEAFLDWVDGLGAEELAAHAEAMTRNGQDRQQDTIQSPQTTDRGDSPSEWFRDMATDAQWTRLEHLKDNPPKLKALVSTTLRRFWEDHFEKLYRLHESDMDQAVELIRSEPDLQVDLAGVLTRMQGRSIELADDWSAKHPQTLLVPLPFMGPYMMSGSVGDPESLILFAFDASRAAGLQVQPSLGLELTKLKALADETRLKILRFVSGSERFGGEIVTYLQISQPGVSRHLRLLKASGLLNVRQEGTSKYYSLCDGELDAIAEAIRQLKSDSRDNAKDGRQ